MLLLFGTSTKSFMKTNLMLCKPLFIVHGELNKVPQLQKWAWHMPNEIVTIKAKFQASVQILL